MIPVTLTREKGHKVTPYFQCVTCLQLFRVRFKSHKRSCVDCEDLRENAKKAAQRAVQREIKAGRLTKATAHRCADCGEKASMWEHRDYTKPLQVEPVCRSCNHARGPARL